MTLGAESWVHIAEFAGQCMWQGWSGDLLPYKSGFTRNRTMLECYHGQKSQMGNNNLLGTGVRLHNGPTSGRIWLKAAPSWTSPGRHLPSWAPTRAGLGSPGLFCAVKSFELGKCCLVTSQSPKLRNPGWQGPHTLLDLDQLCHPLLGQARGRLRTH